MNAQQIIERLEEFDSELYLSYPNLAHRIKVVIIGGAALLLQECIQRSTHDIDIIELSASLDLEILEKYDMDIRSAAFSSNFSDTMDERYIRIQANTKIIDYYMPSLEDLVISKLSSDRGKDTQDVMRDSVYAKVDLSKLDEIMHEIHIAISGHSLSTLRYDFEEFKRRKERYDDEKQRE